LKLTQIIDELIIRLIPVDLGIRRNALEKKYLSNAAIRGENVVLKNNLKITRRTALVLGEDIEIGGKNTIDATAGLMIGDNCKIDKGIQIDTKSNDLYDPIIVGAGNHITSDISPGAIINSKVPVEGLSNFEGQLVFILSTGRSGSKAISKLLDQHEDAEFYHDAFAHLNTWSCEYLYDAKNKEQIKEKLDALYNSMSLGQKKVFGQSDQKLAPLVPLLTELFPNAKFLWLIRDPHDFINSAYARGWFDNSEFGFAQNKKEFLKKKVVPSDFDAAHRCNGAKIGIFSIDEWKVMTAFERICWYWSYWNTLIEEHLEQIESDRSIKIKLSELETKTVEILDFLNLKNKSLSTKKVNEAYYKKPDISQWTEEMKSIFKKHCRDQKQRWGF